MNAQTGLTLTLVCAAGLLVILLLPGIYYFTAGTLSDQSEIGSNPETEDQKLRSKRQAGDECNDEVFKSCASSLPMMADGKTINMRLMPTLSNGHIGFQPYGDTVYLNGLYNGNDETSHRAPIPALVIARIRMSSDEEERQTIRRYTFNAKEGVFQEDIECPFAYITHRMYTHQKYTKVLVNDIYARPKPEIPGGGVIHMSYLTLNSSEDILFQPKEPHYSNWRVVGQTRQAEKGTPTQPINVFWTEHINDLAIRGEVRNETIIMSVDRQRSTAQNDFERVIDILWGSGSNGAHKLYLEHKEAWEKTWYRGAVEVEGDTTVAKVTNFAQYQLLGNLPSMFAYQQPQKDEFLYGIGRSSLGRGSAKLDHQGHVMWDSEVYILPAVLPFHPTLAKEILRYRSEQAHAAQQLAQQYGDKGYRFPWESAYSGGEVTPPGTCPGCVDRQIHVGAGIAFAIRQYFSLTRDREYQTNSDYNGCDMTREIARFYAERAVYNSSEGRYDIPNVMGPDDFHDGVKNNAYTQVAASLAIHWARYFACMCSRNEMEEVPDEWLQKALYMKLPFDNVKRLHYQHEGYQHDPNTTVKQADTILLAYPLNWNMSRDIMKNDLEYYENRLHASSPAMTYSFMTVGWKFAEDYNKMAQYYIKSYQDYLQQPFKVWTEYPSGVSSSSTSNTVNFLPGQGAFLQSLVYGFAGVRIRPEQLEFHAPMPPPGANTLRLRGFKYLGGNFTFTIRSTGSVEIEVHDVSSQFELVLKRNESGKNVEESLSANEIITLENGRDGFFIYSIDGTPCEHPRDYIYMPWGYSPWVNSASMLNPSLTCIIAIPLSLSILLLL